MIEIEYGSLSTKQKKLVKAYGNILDSIADAENATANLVEEYPDVTSAVNRAKGVLEAAEVAIRLTVENIARNYGAEPLDVVRFVYKSGGTVASVTMREERSWL